MIEPMAKAYVATRREGREELLTALRGLGVLHLVPVRPERGEEDGELAGALMRTRRALQILKETAPAGAPPSGPVEEVVAETLEVGRRTEEVRARIVALQRQARDAAMWGGVTKERLDRLGREGLRLRVLTVPQSEVALLPGTVMPVRPVGNHRSLVICVGDEDAQLPPHATLLAPPERDLPSVEREIAELRDELAAIPDRVARLAGRRADLERALATMEDELSLARALSSGLSGDRLYGVQGWLPLERAQSLAADLRAAGIPAAVHVRPARRDERPPTLVRYPRMLRPIRSLFDLLGVRPGYDEADLTAFFMVALPIFAGMLISDAGYGLVFLAMAGYAQWRLRDRIGHDALELIMVFGGVAVVWGAISGSWFGVSPGQMQGAGGWVGRLGSALGALQLIRGTEQQSRDALMKVSFLVGSAHLILAHVRRVMDLAPDTSALADLGWCGVLGAMLAVIWNLFFRDAPLSAPVTHALLVAGGIGFLLVAGFSARDANVLVRVAKGIGGGLFPLIGAFGDTLSYIRLAAVGLASFYLAVAVDTLGAEAAGAATWLAAVPILLLGHGLNMLLSLVAILAHGVRLNLLEFSNHAGLQWTGYAYRPFAARAAREH